MEFKVIWSHAAIVDLKGICDYIAQEDPEAAAGVGRGIIDHLNPFP